MSLDDAQQAEQAAPLIGKTTRVIPTNMPAAPSTAAASTDAPAAAPAAGATAPPPSRSSGIMKHVSAAAHLKPEVRAKLEQFSRDDYSTYFQCR